METASCGRLRARRGRRGRGADLEPWRQRGGEALRPCPPPRRRQGSRSAPRPRRPCRVPAAAGCRFIALGETLRAARSVTVGANAGRPATGQACSRLRSAAPGPRPGGSREYAPAARGGARRPLGTSGISEHPAGHHRKRECFECLQLRGAECLLGASAAVPPQATVAKPAAFSPDVTRPASAIRSLSVASATARSLCSCSAETPSSAHPFGCEADVRRQDAKSRWPSVQKCAAASPPAPAPSRPVGRRWVFRRVHARSRRRLRTQGKGPASPPRATAGWGD